VSESVAPDYVAPIIGWRVWLIIPDADSLRLGSIVFQAPWPPGEPLVADCLRHRGARLLFRGRRGLRHAAPKALCECGIYAAADPARLDSYLDNPYPRRRTVHRVVGRVALWGRVVECENGWRASHAYPEHLYVPVPAAEADPTAANAIAEQLSEYQVPVELVRLPERRRQLMSWG
jgi:hypothetical protein